jgi:hypothetical protein
MRGTDFIFFVLSYFVVWGGGIINKRVGGGVLAVPAFVAVGVIGIMIGIYAVLSIAVRENYEGSKNPYKGTNKDSCVQK